MEDLRVNDNRFGQEGEFSSVELCLTFCRSCYHCLPHKATLDNLNR
jgi:hypothetical protein